MPKTIDNDLSATAFTFGFDSAVACATDALDRLHTTAASHERVMVLEVMGRHAGWIALHAGIAGGGDVILIPEIPWTFENVCHKILEREQHGKKFTLIVVAEGAQLPDGGMVGQQRARRARRSWAASANIVAREIERRLQRETRVVVLGHLQRGGAPTTFDRVLATQYGAHAVRLIVEGRLRRDDLLPPAATWTSVPIMQAVNRIRAGRSARRRRAGGPGAGHQLRRRLSTAIRFMSRSTNTSTVADTERNAMERSISPNQRFRSPWPETEAASSTACYRS